MTHAFLSHTARILNAGQARVVVLHGNVHDLFAWEGQDLPLAELLAAAWGATSRILVTYELNGPIRFARQADLDAVRAAWTRWRTGLGATDLAIGRMLALDRPGHQARFDQAERSFDQHLAGAVGRPTVALELLRQLCLCSREMRDGRPLLDRDLVVVVEAADLILPEAEVTRLGDADRHRLHICHDWFCDPGFMNGGDSVLLLSESRSQLNGRITGLPQVVGVAVPAPDLAARHDYLDRFLAGCDNAPACDPEALAQGTAGLTIQALRQLLLGGCHAGRINASAVVARVEDHIRQQLGEDVVEFKRPTHRLDAVVGFTRLKRFLREEFIPRCRAKGDGSLPGAAVSGPIGAGKTFIFEAVAAELDAPVLALKNIRSQWFGGTDVLFERLRRVLEALDRVVIMVDEADTQFGGVGAGEHSTERRLTGRIQQMMSDPRLRGRVFWLLMTARIHLLSPDIRRPGRVGDLIIPVLDPDSRDDRLALARWMARPALGDELSPAHEQALLDACAGFSAAAYASMRSRLTAEVARRPLDLDALRTILHDHLTPAIGPVRRYQTLQALCNCTRRSLLPEPGVTEDRRAAWFDEIRRLEAVGIR